MGFERPPYSSKEGPVSQLKGVWRLAREAVSTDVLISSLSHQLRRLLEFTRSDEFSRFLAAVPDLPLNAGYTVPRQLRCNCR